MFGDAMVAAGAETSSPKENKSGSGSFGGTSGFFDSLFAEFGELISCRRWLDETPASSSFSSYSSKRLLLGPES